MWIAWLHPPRHTCGALPGVSRQRHPCVNPHFHTTSVCGLPKQDCTCVRATKAAYLLYAWGLLNFLFVCFGKFLYLLAIKVLYFVFLLQCGFWVWWGGSQSWWDESGTSDPNLVLPVVGSVLSLYHLLPLPEFPGFFSRQERNESKRWNAMEGEKWDHLHDPALIPGRKEEDVSLLICHSTELGVILPGHGVGAVFYGCVQKLPLFLWEMGTFPHCPLVV